MRAFWTAYRVTFDVLHSVFRNVFADGATGLAALVWITTATAYGNHVSYDGVCFLEFDGGGEMVCRFHAYFDP